jgi:hypothetical protein
MVGNHDPASLGIPILSDRKPLYPLVAFADGSVFDLPGTFAVDGSGQASYTIPIQVPPGTASMAPNLSLAYSSGGGNGLLGMGWSLVGIPSITRCAPTIAQDGSTYNSVSVSSAVTYTASDDFCYRGQKLMAINGGAYGGDGTEYRTEVESFARIISHGAIAYVGSGTSPAWFEMWTKSGQHMIFGSGGNSLVTAIRIGSGNIPAAWALNQVSDIVGNYMNINYAAEDTSNGGTYPLEIDYTGNSNAGQAPYNAVKFVYTSQPVNLIDYQSGAPTLTKKLLTDIKTYTGTSSSPGTRLVSDFQIAYNLSSTNREQLQSVTHCDGAASQSCLPPTQFGYTTAGTIVPTAVGLPSPTGYGVALGDFTGSGAASVMSGIQFNGVYGGGGLTFFVNDGSGNFAKATSWSVPTLPANLPDGTPCTVNALGFGGYKPIIADFNGDGMADIYWDCGTREGYLWISTGSGFTQYSVNVPAKTGTTSDNTFYTPIAIDLNGDGQADLLFYSIYFTTASQSSKYYVGLSNNATTPGGFSFQSHPWPFTYALSSTDSLSYFLLPGDFNNDGRADLFVVQGDGPSDGFQPGYFLSSGTNWLLKGNGDGTFTNVPIVADGVAGWMPYVGNFGLDGNAGILWTQPLNGDNPVETQARKLWIGRGDGSFVVSKSLGACPRISEGRRVSAGCRDAWAV